MWMFRRKSPVAVIRFGGGMNRDWYVNDARKNGYKVLFVDGGCLLYR